MDSVLLHKKRWDLEMDGDDRHTALWMYLISLNFIYLTCLQWQSNVA